MKRTAMKILLPLVALALCSCLRNEEASALASEQPQKAPAGWAEELMGKLRIGVDPGYYPMIFRDEGGKVDGFDVDFAKLLAEQLGVAPVLVEEPFDKLKDAVIEHRVDVALSAIEILPPYHKAELVPYFDLPQVLVAKVGTPHSEIFAGKIIGTLTISPARAVFHERQSMGEVRGVRGYESDANLHRALEDGKVDAIVVNLPSAEALVKRSGGALEILGSSETSQPLGVAIDPSRFDLAKAIREAILSLQVSGKVDELATRWFGGPS